MDFLNFIKSRRTIRQFQKKGIPQKILKECVDAARMAPSAKNLQPLEYIIVCDQKPRQEIFETLSWGGELAEGRPAKNREPQAFVIVLYDSQIKQSMPDVDVGLAIENLILAAHGKGIGSCIIGAVERDKIKKICQVPENFEIKLVIALGYPAEKSIVEDVDERKKYWRDSKNILFVPKRKLEKVIHVNKF